MIARKLPLLGDVRDESAEDVRLVLEPKSRAVDPLVLMESCSSFPISKSAFRSTSTFCRWARCPR
jgi:DNA gyrase/topoisomerase IV subunit A